MLRPVSFPRKSGLKFPPTLWRATWALSVIPALLSLILAFPIMRRKHVSEIQDFGSSARVTITTTVRVPSLPPEQVNNDESGILNQWQVRTSCEESNHNRERASSNSCANWL